jgi:hypothetical protein
MVDSRPKTGHRCKGGLGKLLARSKLARTACRFVIRLRCDAGNRRTAEQCFVRLRFKKEAKRCGAQTWKQLVAFRTRVRSHLGQSRRKNVTEGCLGRSWSAINRNNQDRSLHEEGAWSTLCEKGQCVLALFLASLLGLSVAFHYSSRKGIRDVGPMAIIRLCVMVLIRPVSLEKRRSLDSRRPFIDRIQRPASRTTPLRTSTLSRLGRPISYPCSIVIVSAFLAMPRAINWQASGPAALPVAESSTTPTVGLKNLA